MNSRFAPRTAPVGASSRPQPLRGERYDVPAVARAVTETPARTPADAPAEVPADAPAEVPADTPLARLPDALRVAITRRGFSDMTSVQVAAIDAVDDPRDLLISSETGSGKTVALGIVLSPSLEAASGTTGGPTALVVVPTRELAAQVQGELRWLFAEMRDVRVECVTGGTSVWQDRQRLAASPRVLVGTPGRLVDHLSAGALSLDRVEHLILDEADQMLELGFRDQLNAIVDVTPAERRTHLVSATFPPAVRALTARYQSKPLHVEGTRLGEANQDIEHVAHAIRESDRYRTLVNVLLLSQGQRTLVFVDTRAETSTLAEKLTNDGFAALALSGELQQHERTRTLSLFRSGAANVLVATDVAARGLDVPDVATVVQTSVPGYPDVYTHRSGRTGRAGRAGRCILLVIERQVGRARFLLSKAGVDVGWQPPPSAATVRKVLAEREREDLREALDARERDEDSAVTGSIGDARALLDGRDPIDVVALLLERTRTGTLREPFDIEPPAPRRKPARFERGADTGRFPRARYGARDGRDAREQSSPRAGSAKRGHNARTKHYDWFFISYGERRGANPKRIMAMICRRGCVTSREIGSISIGPNGTTFEVSREHASGFEVKASRVDARDPRIRVERARPLGTDRTYNAAPGETPRPTSPTA